MHPEILKFDTNICTPLVNALKSSQSYYDENLEIPFAALVFVQDKAVTKAVLEPKIKVYLSGLTRIQRMIANAEVNLQDINKKYKNEFTDDEKITLKRAKQALNMQKKNILPAFQSNIVSHIQSLYPESYQLSSYPLYNQDPATCVSQAPVSTATVQYEASVHANKKQKLDPGLTCDDQLLFCDEELDSSQDSDDDTKRSKVTI